ncbi:GSCOCG00011047001-RA-CDS [Cotesia congregata]|nr:GSCOCG00011047001-RA-CDS [Cotesia congregata]
MRRCKQMSSRISPVVKIKLCRGRSPGTTLFPTMVSLPWARLYRRIIIAEKIDLLLVGCRASWRPKRLLRNWKPCSSFSITPMG